MTRFDPALALPTLRAHRPRLTLLVLVVAARLLLTGCATTQPAIAQSTAVEVAPNEAYPTDDWMNEPVEQPSSTYLTPIGPDVYDPGHELIPGC